jgi:hypothetical protein
LTADSGAVFTVRVNDRGADAVVQFETREDGFDEFRAREERKSYNATFESGRLQPIAVNPDGVPYAYRIIDPRQFILSASFDL